MPRALLASREGEGACGRRVIGMAAGRLAHELGCVAAAGISRNAAVTASGMSLGRIGRWLFRFAGAAVERDERARGCCQPRSIADPLQAGASTARGSAGVGAVAES